MSRVSLNVTAPPDNPDAPWYADGLSFTCTQCGNCCTGGPGYVWVSEVEIDRLAAHLKMERDEVLQRYCRKISGRISLKETLRAGLHDCVFLKEIPAEPRGAGGVAQTRRVCGIYAVRPLQCRTWPFWQGNLASPENWSRAGSRCPGMDRGRRYTLQQIESLRDAPDWPDNPPGSDAPGSSGSHSPPTPPHPR